MDRCRVREACNGKVPTFWLDTLEQLEEEINRRVGHPVNVSTHSIEVLFALTGARDRLLQDPKNPAALRAYQRCNQWKPAWRYSPDDGDEDACNNFMEAVEEFSRYVVNNI